MIKITLPIPPSLNRCYKNVPKIGRAPTKVYMEWQKIALLILSSEKQKIEGRFYATLAIGQCRSNRDIDNIFKPIFDTLVKKEIIVDDDISKMISCCGFRQWGNIEKEFVEIVLYPENELNGFRGAILKYSNNCCL